MLPLRCQLSTAEHAGTSTGSSPQTIQICHLWYCALLTVCQRRRAWDSPSSARSCCRRWDSCRLEHAGQLVHCNTIKLPLLARQYCRMPQEKHLFGRCFQAQTCGMSMQFPQHSTIPFCPCCDYHSRDENQCSLLPACICAVACAP